MAKSKTSEILGAIVEDVVHSLTGAPVATVKSMRVLIPDWLYKPEHYLKWDDMGFILSNYRSEWERLMNFSFNKKKYYLPQILEIDNTERNIPVKNIKAKCKERYFKLDNEIQGFTEKIFEKYLRYLSIRRRKYVNGSLYRLSEFKWNGNDLCLIGEGVRYEDVCKSNLCLDAADKDSEETLRGLVHKKEKIEPLTESRLANPLGVNFLLLTSDGKLVMPQRSRKVVVRPSQLSPSFSGDIEYTDISDRSKQISFKRLMREGFEELSFLFEDHLIKDRIWFLGMTRELVRGGKPEMFFEAHTNLTEKQFTNLHSEARDKWEFRKAKSFFRRKNKSWLFWQLGGISLLDVPNKDDKYYLRINFESLIREEAYRISVPLMTNLVLFMKRRFKNTTFT